MQFSARLAHKLVFGRRYDFLLIVSIAKPHQLSHPHVVNNAHLVTRNHILNLSLVGPMISFRLPKKKFLWMWL